MKFISLLIIIFLPLYSFSVFPVSNNTTSIKTETLEDYKVGLNDQLYNSLNKSSNNNYFSRTIKIILYVVATVFIILLIAILNISLKKPNFGSIWVDLTSEW